MSTSLRFRSRQGESNVEHSSIQRWQSAIKTWSQHLQGSLSRYAPHLVVILAAIVVFSSNPLKLDDIEGYDLPQRATPTASPPLGFRVGQEPFSGRGGFRDPNIEIPVPRARELAPRPAASFRPLMNSDLLQFPVAHTTIPERLRREVITYVVERGDTVLGIASKFGLSPETVMWANGDLERNPDLLRPGQELIILPIDGVYHTVIKGDTLLKIAKKYQAEVDEIVHCVYNELDLEDAQIAPGQKLVVPGGIKPYIPRQVTAYKGPIPTDAKQGTGLFKWPTSGRITDRFGFRTYAGRWHTGLDISGYTGAPIYASDSGFVTFAGWTDQGYGKLVIIDHGNGFVTYYGHLSVCYVSAGQSVGQGTLIAAMGSTGKSTGPHLHFEIRNKGVQKNPELYLP
jgi:murein DD-endopeptidase MepM/ murein hydrolase activator NlpD